MIKGKKSDIDFVERNIDKKLEDTSIPEKLVNMVQKLYKWMTDENVPLGDRLMAAGALAYFIIPLDGIPDLAPIIGWLDDIGVVSFALSYLSAKYSDYF